MLFPYAFYARLVQVTASDDDVERPNNIIYFLTGPGTNIENPSDSIFDINKATGEIFVLKVGQSSALGSVRKILPPLSASDDKQNKINAVNRVGMECKVFF